VLTLGYVRRADLFIALSKDVQVAAIGSEPAFRLVNPETEEVKVETVRQAIYRLGAEMKEVVCWLDVVKFFNSPNYEM
jgi:hypothetical protein